VDEPRFTKPPLTVVADCGEGAWTVHVRGVLDAATAPLLDARLAVLIRLGTLDLVVDLAGVRALDDAGLTALRHAARGATEAGLGFAVVAPPGGAAHRAIALARIDAELRPAPDEAAAHATARATSHRRHRTTALTPAQVSRQTTPA
jgi:anti-anti-sigma factor